jgi:hypothetical protein
MGDHAVHVTVSVVVNQLWVRIVERGGRNVQSYFDVFWAFFWALSHADSNVFREVAMSG